MNIFYLNQESCFQQAGTFLFLTSLWFLVSFHSITGILFNSERNQCFLFSFQSLASQVTKKDLEEGRLYPPLSTIREVSTKVAVHLAEYAYKHRCALRYPEPEDKEKFIRAYQYKTDYETFVPAFYDWPGHKVKL